MTGTTLDDYSQVLDLPGKDGLPRIIVGGQAVNFWATFYLKTEPTLNRFVPFHSKDLDLLGTSIDLLDLAKKTGFKIAQAENKTFIPSAGYLLMPLKSGDTVKVEILKRIYGIQTHEIQDKAVVLDYSGHQIRVIDPISLLKAKMENAVNLEQKRPHGDRQDEKHMRIMIVVTQTYLRETIANIGLEKFSVRDCLDFHEEVVNICSSKSGKKAIEMYDIKWEDALPIEDLEHSEHSQLKNFITKRWHRVKTDLYSKKISSSRH